MKNQEQLIKYYEQRLEKVKVMWSLDSDYIDTERAKEYVENAEQQLEAVKNGRNY